MSGILRADDPCGLAVLRRVSKTGMPAIRTMTVDRFHFDSEVLDRAGEILVSGPLDGQEEEWTGAVELINLMARSSRSTPQHIPGKSAQKGRL